MGLSEKTRGFLQKNYFHHFKDQKGLEEQLENLVFYPKLADIT